MNALLVLAESLPADGRFLGEIVAVLAILGVLGKIWRSAARIELHVETHATRHDKHEARLDAHDDHLAALDRRVDRVASTGGFPDELTGRYSSIRESTQNGPPVAPRPRIPSRGKP